MSNTATILIDGELLSRGSDCGQRGSIVQRGEFPQRVDFRDDRIIDQRWPSKNVCTMNDSVANAAQLIDERLSLQPVDRGPRRLAVLHCVSRRCFSDLTLSAKRRHRIFADSVYHSSGNAPRLLDSDANINELELER